MAYIEDILVDPDDLNSNPDAYGTTTDCYTSDEVKIDTANLQITLNQAGNLSSAGDGVTGQCLYSFLKDRWKNTPELTSFDFPMLSITNEQFEFQSGWVPINDTTRKKIKTAGWAEVDSSGTTQKMYAGIVTLGTLVDNTDQVYFAQDSSLTATTINTTYTGVVNEPVLIFTEGGSDDRGYFVLYVRERGKLYASASKVDIGVSGNMTTVCYRFPLANATDLNLDTSSDTELKVSGTGFPCDVVPYDDYQVTYLAGSGFAPAEVGSYSVNDVAKDGADRWYICTGAGDVDATDINDLGTMGGAGTSTWTTFTGEREVESGAYSAYNIIIDANVGQTVPGGTKTQIYDWAQYALRQTVEVDTDTSRYGNVASSLCEFIGDNLHTAQGVFIDDIAATDVNNVTFYDVNDSIHLYPLYVTVTINFNANLSDNTDTENDSIFRAYYKDISITDAELGAGTNVITLPNDTGYSDDDLIGYDVTITGSTGSTDDGQRTITDNTSTAITVDGSALTLTEEVTLDIEGDAFGESGALQVKRSDTTNVGSDLSYLVPENVAGSSYQFSYAYDGDTTGGRTTGVDTDIVVVALGLTKGQYVQAEGTITNTGATIGLVSALERNYQNEA